MCKLREIKPKDAPTLRSLAEKCAPLDVHTPYTYWVVANYYRKGSYILEDDGSAVGYIMTVETDECLFIWQIGLLELYRGKGLSQTLIEAVYNYAVKRQKNMEVTIAETNAASYSAFSHFCTRKNVGFNKAGSVEIRKPDDSPFEENEIMYRIKVV